MGMIRSTLHSSFSARISILHVPINPKMSPFVGVEVRLYVQTELWIQMAQDSMGSGLRGMENY